MNSFKASTGNDPVDIVSARLIAARRQRDTADDRACSGLLTTVEQAYEVQDRVFAALESDQPEGACARYWKSGGPSRAEPVRHAPLLSDGVRPSGASLADLPLRLHWVEAEIALRLGRDVNADDVQGLTQAQALEWVDAMAVTIELVDSRWHSGSSAEPLLKVADSLMHGALAIGDFVPFAPRDWRQQACHVRIGGQPVQTFVGSLGIGDPAFVLPGWLRHVTRGGAVARAGTVVSCGSWCGVLRAEAGWLIEADFAGVGNCFVQL